MLPRSLPVLVWLLLLASAGCGTAGGPRRVPLQLRLEATKGAFAPHRNSAGVDVTLTAADLALDRVVLLEGEPLAQRLLRGLSPIREAWAHPGHGSEADVVGELPGPAATSLGEGPLFGPSGEGLTGEARSARLELRDGVAARVEGTLGTGSAAVAFRAEATAAELGDVIGGARVNPGEIEGPAIVVVEVDVARWVDQLDLVGVTPAPGGTVTDLPSDTRAGRLFVRGAMEAGAYRIRVESGSGAGP